MPEYVGDTTAPLRVEGRVCIGVLAALLGDIGEPAVLLAFGLTSPCASYTAWTASGGRYFTNRIASRVASSRCNVSLCMRLDSSSCFSSRVRVA